MKNSIKSLIVIFVLTQAFSTDLNARWFGGQASDAIKDWWNNEPGKAKLERASARKKIVDEKFTKAQALDKTQREKLFKIIEKKYDWYINQAQAFNIKFQNSLNHNEFEQNLLKPYLTEVETACKNLESILKQQKDGFEAYYIKSQNVNGILQPNRSTSMRRSTSTQGSTADTTHDQLKRLSDVTRRLEAENLMLRSDNSSLQSIVSELEDRLSIRSAPLPYSRMQTPTPSTAATYPPANRPRTLTPPVAATYPPRATQRPDSSPVAATYPPRATQRPLTKTDSTAAFVDEQAARVTSRLHRPQNLSTYQIPQGSSNHEPF